jgi:hypothetical protein
MKLKTTLRGIIREEIGKVLNEQVEEYVIYAEVNGKKDEINRVPKQKLQTALTNIGMRYADDMDVIIAAMKASDWDKIS